MKAAVVDDEKLCMDEIFEILHNFEKQNNISIDISGFKSGEEFLEALETESYSIVFMDIFMEGISGIETAKRMREKDSRCILVFLTSSMEFMPAAFSCHAFEYIAKPFTQERVFQVLGDALRVLPATEKYIEILSGRKTVSIFLSDIISAVTDAHYLEIRLKDGTGLRSRLTISGFIKLTGDDSRFLLVNKGIILNIDYITEIENNTCTMETGAKFPIRVREGLKIEQAVQDYNFEKIRRTQQREE